MNAAAQQAAPGTLVSIGVHRLGLQSYHYHQCITCGAEFPELPRGIAWTLPGSPELPGRISCNGVAITTCPWHGPDSQANTRARGDHFRGQP